MHIILIHFPSALLPMECVCYALYYFRHNFTFGYAAFYSMTGGVLIGWMAAVTGLLDLAKISQEKSRALNTALAHGTINVTVLIVYSIFLYKAWKQPEAAPTLTALIVKSILIVMLFTGNFLGGNLLLKHKVGVEN